MPGYRFCRSDDVAYLVDAYNSSLPPEETGRPPLTVAEFKRRIREDDLWCSSCMVAYDGDELIGVMLAAKRETETCFLALGVRADRRRQGHARHMLDSLAQKLAILGPPVLLAELPVPGAGEGELFRSLGYQVDTRYIDWEAPAQPAEAPPAELVVPVDLEAVEEAGLLGDRGTPSWCRTKESLANHEDRLRGVGVAAGDTLEAAMLWVDAEGLPRRILFQHIPPGNRGETMFGLLLAACRADSDGAAAVELPRLEEGRLSPELLRRHGFREGQRHVRVSTRAGH